MNILINALRKEAEERDEKQKKEASKDTMDSRNRNHSDWCRDSSGSTVSWRLNYCTVH